MGGISVERAAAVAIIVQSLYFGVYGTLFALTQFIVLGKRSVNLNRPLWLASFFMMIIAVAHLAIDADRIQVAFIGFSNDAAGRAAFLGSVSEGTYLAKSVLYQIQTYIGDACIIYRTYMLHGRKLWVVALPLTLLGMVMVAGCGMIWSYAHAPPGSTPFEVPQWAVPYVGGTLITNLFCTSLIIIRICRLSPPSMELFRFTPILVLIESGAVYTASVAILTALCAVGSNGYTIIIDLLPPIIGITFCVIIIRVHNERGKANPIAGLRTDVSHNNIVFDHTGSARSKSPAGTSIPWTPAEDIQVGTVIDIGQDYKRFEQLEFEGDGRV